MRDLWPGPGDEASDRVGQARDFLPEEANEPIVQKQEADAQPIIWMAFSSDRHSKTELADLASDLHQVLVQNLLIREFGKR